jgi:hypothetical protein
LNAFARVYQDYGIFGGDAFVSVNNRFPSGLSSEGWESRATGVSEDTWTITGGVGQGRLTLGFSVSGSASSSGSFPVVGGSFSADAHMGINIFTDSLDHSVETTGPIYQAGVYQADRIPGALQFTFGVPFSVQITSFVSASTGYEGNLPSFAGIAQASFGHTATLSSVVVTDIFGDPISGTHVTASSGTIYPLIPRDESSSVPEPGSLMIMLSGAIILAGCGWCRRRGRPALKA